MGDNYYSPDDTGRCFPRFIGRYAAAADSGRMSGVAARLISESSVERLAVVLCESTLSLRSLLINLQKKISNPCKNPFMLNDNSESDKIIYEQVINQ